jgi:hypothetical protein
MSTEEGLRANCNLDVEESDGEGKTPITHPPDDSAGLDHWREWGMRLRLRISQLEETDRGRKIQLQKLRKEVASKNKVFGVYKARKKENEARIEELEKRLEELEEQLGRRTLKAMLREFLNSISARWFRGH